MIITEIKKNRNAPGYAVFADGQFLFSLDGETILSEGLTKGSHLTEEDAERLQNLSLYYKAKEKALRLLDKRAHSKNEIIRKVSENYPREAAEKAADSLEELGLINDREFAVLYVRELSEFKRFGIRRIVTELYKKGVDREIIDEVTAELREKDNSEVICEMLSRKRFDLSDEKVRRRVFGKLMRDGYSYDDINKAFAAFSDGQESDTYD